jgi:enamine deaminase RidA (YjgF/YER057c/UK114 family)
MNRREWMMTGAGLTAGLGLAWAFGRAEGDGPEARLKELKLELPKLSPPKGATIVPAVRTGDLLFLSGHLPSIGGKLITGKLGKDVTVEEGRKAARQIGLITLAVVRQELGSLDKVVRLVKTLGMVNCTPDFTQQPAVINGFSDLLVEVFGEKNGKGARSAVGMASLPSGGCVEIECIFQVK